MVSLSLWIKMWNCTPLFTKPRGDFALYKNCSGHYDEKNAFAFMSQLYFFISMLVLIRFIFWIRHKAHCFVCPLFFKRSNNLNCTCLFQIIQIMWVTLSWKNQSAGNNFQRWRNQWRVSLFFFAPNEGDLLSLCVIQIKRGPCKDRVM